MRKNYLAILLFFLFLNGYGQILDFDKSIKLYPNPAYHVLSVRSDSPLERVEIYTLVGDKVQIIKKNFKNIPLKNIPRGIYMVKIYSRKGYTVKKLIKE